MSDANHDSLDKKKLAGWIYELWADDYNRCFLMSTPVEIHKAILIDDRTIEVQFEFWDDEHHVTDDQECFMFDIDIGNEYGENFPAHLVNVLHTVRYTWKTVEDRQVLSKNLESEDLIEQDIFCCEWDDPKISDDLIEHFIAYNNPDFLKAMLLERYNAVSGLPKCIPDRLAPYFTKILNS